MISTADTRDLIIDAIRDRKGHSITLVDLDTVAGASARCFIIAEGNSSTQVGAIADHLEERLLEDARLKAFNSDGRRNAEWVVMDYGDVWVHIFMPEARAKYNLEELWSDAAITNFPD